jgi:hypothetical protein
MANSTLITDYLGSGLAAARPATPNISSSGCALWYSTNTDVASIYTVADGWNSVGGGTSPGTPPTIVQVASSVTASASITLGAAPTNGNLLVCIAGAGGTSVGAGWTSLVNSSSGSDFSVIAYKIAGASESATQTPLGSSSNVAMTVWEIHGQNATPFVNAALGVNASGPLFCSTANAPGLSNVLNLAQLSTDGGSTATLGSALNMTQDTQINTGSTRHLLSGHSTGALPVAQMLTTLSVAEGTRYGLVQVTT